MAAKTLMFRQCKDLISKLQASELLVRSDDPQSAEQVEEIIAEEGEKRKNIREIRLERYPTNSSYLFLFLFIITFIFIYNYLLYFQSANSSRYTKMAKVEQDFQCKVMASIDVLTEQLQENREFRERSLAAFERLVSSVEAQNKFYCC